MRRQAGPQGVTSLERLVAAGQHFAVALHQLRRPQRLKAAIENSQPIPCRAASRRDLGFGPDGEQGIAGKCFSIAGNQIRGSGKILPRQIESQFAFIYGAFLRIAPLPSGILPLGGRAAKRVTVHHFQRPLPGLPRALGLSRRPALLRTRRRLANGFQSRQLFLRFQAALIEIRQVKIRGCLVAGSLRPVLPVALGGIEVQSLLVFQGAQRVERRTVLVGADESRQRRTRFARRTPKEHFSSGQLHQPVERLFDARARFGILQPAGDSVARAQQQAGALPNHQRSRCRQRRRRQSNRAQTDSEAGSVRFGHGDKLLGNIALREPLQFAPPRCPGCAPCLPPLPPAHIRPKARPSAG